MIYYLFDEVVQLVTLFPSACIQIIGEVAAANRCECQLAGLKSILRVLEKVNNHQRPAGLKSILRVLEKVINH